MLKKDTELAADFIFKIKNKVVAYNKIFSEETEMTVNKRRDIFPWHTSYWSDVTFSFYPLKMYFSLCKTYCHFVSARQLKNFSWITILLS